MRTPLKAIASTALLLLSGSRSAAQIQDASALDLRSPDGRLTLRFRINASGTPFYQLSMGDKVVLRPSLLGIEINDAPGFSTGFVILGSDTSSKDETWEPVWGS